MLTHCFSIAEQIDTHQNTPQTSPHYADILRTPAEALRYLALMVGVVMAVDLEDGVQTSGCEVRHLPGVMPACISQDMQVCFSVWGETPSNPPDFSTAVENEVLMSAILLSSPTT